MKEKIGYISQYSVEDKRAWSGTIHFLYTSLADKYEVLPITVKPNFVQKVARKIVWKITKGRRSYTYADYLFYKISLERQIKNAMNQGVHVFFAPAASVITGTIKVPDHCKIVYLSDATYHLMVNYYFEAGTARDYKLHDLIEKRSLENAKEIIYPSNWAKEDAVNYYHIEQEKIHVVPFGGNLIDEYREKNCGNPIKILFVGVEWERKGTDLAVRCVELLNRMQNELKFELNIIGLNHPSGYEVSEDIHFIGRLNKDNQDEYDKMIAYYKESDIFLLPTKAECAGIVFCEAAMYGLPIFTHNTGGVMECIEDYVTGRALPLGSTAEDFAIAILDMFKQGKYAEWSKVAREKYEKELNWKHWMEACEAIIEKE